MREYKLHLLRLMFLALLLYGMKIVLVLDGTIVEIANVNWARTQKIRRDNGKVVEFEEVKYGMLMMVLCLKDSFWSLVVLE